MTNTIFTKPMDMFQEFSETRHLFWSTVPSQETIMEERFQKFEESKRLSVAESKQVEEAADLQETNSNVGNLTVS